MKAAELLVHYLANEAVDTVFGLPSEETLDRDIHQRRARAADYRENLKLTEELGRLVCPL